MSIQTSQFIPLHLSFISYLSKKYSLFIRHLMEDNYYLNIFTLPVNYRFLMFFWCWLASFFFFFHILICLPFNLVIDPDARKHWKQKEKGVAEDDMDR